MSTQEFWWEINIPLNESVNWNTLVTRYEDGTEQRRQKWSSPKRSYEITLRGRQQSEVEQVWSFYNARKGAYDTFYFRNPIESPVTSEVLGTGNGSKTAFQLVNYPLPSGSPSAVTVGGVAKTEITHYTVTRATGVITFGSAPVSGDSVVATYDFSRIVRFAEDKLTRELFGHKILNVGLPLMEVR